MKSVKPVTVHDYIKNLPAGQKECIQRLRELIRKSSPKAEELISYGMPAFYQNGMLVYYAAFTKHYSLFPASGKTFIQFAEQLKDYKTSKGTIQFSYEKPLPAKLITAIIKFRIKENAEKQKLKDAKRKNKK